MARRVMGWVLILFTLALVGCDHATKAVAQAALERRGPLSIVPGVLDLRYAENRDMAFSLLRGIQSPAKVAVLLVCSMIVLGVVLLGWWSSRRASVTEQAGYALIVAGALGNAIDRGVRGYVIDFIHLHRWPVFNVADIAIVAGGILLGIAMFRRARQEPREAS
ncbi:signal peptidase II [Sorangium sp. So ce204]|uniref:signal peptidase II n=1 Tax=Sorangium sp. So ce204 TaxID=3133288 RepID=UPI003F6076D7